MEKAKYNDFKETVMIAVEFSEGNSTEDIDDLCQDWYVIYKESNTVDPIQWIEDHFSLGVSRDTHSFWLSERGLMLFRMAKEIDKLNKRFQVAGK